MERLFPTKKARDLNIMAAYDGSISGMNALRQALRFAKRENGKVEVVTVLPTYEGDLEIGLMSHAREAMREPGEKLLTEARHIAEEEGVAISAILEEGRIHEAIIEAALETDSELLVVGRKGLTRLEKAFMGDITSKVIGYSPIDILVMPRESEFKLENLLIAVDDSACSEIAANRAINLAKAYGSKLNVVSVVDVTDEFYSQAPALVDTMIQNAKQLVAMVKSMAESLGVSAEAFVKEGDTHKKIVELADELGVDTICMGSHGRTGLRKFLMGSVTERVIGETTKPVMVIKSC